MDGIVGPDFAQKKCMSHDNHEKSLAFLFTGQGTQCVNVGLDAVQRSNAAAEIWTIADAHTMHQFGFSIREIVEQNPPCITLPQNRVDAHATTWSHPQGVIHLTQFTQVALLVAGIGYWAALRERQEFTQNFYFAGHSLGEWIALVASGMMPLSIAIELVFIRGLLMQRCTPRDAHGVSQYRMVTVNPKRCGINVATFEAMIAATTRASTTSDAAVYLANYNVTDEQYTCVGTRAALQTLAETLSEAAATPARGLQLLEGIDIPFHSPFLARAAVEFRAHCATLMPATFARTCVAARWIPNLTGEWIASAPPIARATVIDLLTQQIAAPVQWIRTQEALLTRAHKHPMRFIEIGPRPVLATMLQKMLQQQTWNVAPHVLHVVRDIFSQSV